MLELVANKEALLTVKVAPQLLADFKIAATEKGATMSALIHMYVVKIVREEKEKNPEVFKKRNDSERPVVRAKIGKVRKTRQANG